MRKRKKKGTNDEEKEYQKKNGSIKTKSNEKVESNVDEKEYYKNQNK